MLPEYPVRVGSRLLAGRLPAITDDANEQLTPTLLRTATSPLMRIARFTQLLKRVPHVLHRGGVRLLVHRLLMERSERFYSHHVKKIRSEPTTSDSQGLVDADGRLIRFSIIMPVFNPEVEWLEQALQSIALQTFPNWELCVADDASTVPGVQETLTRFAAKWPRTRLLFRRENGHICRATNDAIDLAIGEFLVLVDHDDILDRDALHNFDAMLNERPDAEIVYSDEDKVDASGRQYAPYFKPDFNYDLFLSHNMISHLGCYRATTVREIGGMREGYEGAQDYDLALRVLDQVGPKRIVHVPRVLYHWRTHERSTALSRSAKPYAADAARRAVTDHLTRRQVNGEVLSHPEVLGAHRVYYQLPASRPVVSVVILTAARDTRFLRCLEGVLRWTTYDQLQVILVVNNHSADGAAFQKLLPDWLKKDQRLNVVHDPSPFNFAELINRHATRATGELLLLLNDDVEVIEPDWLAEMVGHAIQPGVGAVGARLWYPNGRLQHAGVVMGLGGVAGHVYTGFPKGATGRNGRAALTQNFSAVTGACLLVSHKLFDMVGGLDPRFAISYNDVDFCLRLVELGYRNVWTPFAQLVHAESATRLADTTPQKRQRLKLEAALLAERWEHFIEQDPSWNPNLSLNRPDARFLPEAQLGRKKEDR